MNCSIVRPYKLTELPRGSQYASVLCLLQENKESIGLLMRTHLQIEWSDLKLSTRAAPARFTYSHQWCKKNKVGERNNALKKKRVTHETGLI